MISTVEVTEMIQHGPKFSTVQNKFQMQKSSFQLNFHNSWSALQGIAVNTFYFLYRALMSWLKDAENLMANIVNMCALIANKILTKEDNW